MYHAQNDIDERLKITSTKSVVVDSVSWWLECLERDHHIIVFHGGWRVWREITILYNLKSFFIVD